MKKLSFALLPLLLCTLAACGQSQIPLDARIAEEFSSSEKVLSSLGSGIQNVDLVAAAPDLEVRVGQVFGNEHIFYIILDIKPDPAADAEEPTIELDTLAIEITAPESDIKFAGHSLRIVELAAPSDEGGTSLLVCFSPYATIPRGDPIALSVIIDGKRGQQQYSFGPYEITWISDIVTPIKEVELFDEAERKIGTLAVSAFKLEITLFGTGLSVGEVLDLDVQLVMKNGDVWQVPSLSAITQNSYFLSWPFVQLLELTQLDYVLLGDMRVAIG